MVGFRDIERMPPRLASFAVAVATLAAGILALAMADHDSGGLTLTLLGIPRRPCSSAVALSATRHGGRGKRLNPISG
ncbi:hypothetical protein N8D56_12365 [Devosia sp. A8/3-2]|nr:hypothetical protein N8D56_12365 [Devosia sp. A8/3-2]